MDQQHAAFLTGQESLSPPPHLCQEIEVEGNLGIAPATATFLRLSKQ